MSTRQTRKSSIRLVKKLNRIFLFLFGLILLSSISIGTALAREKLLKDIETTGDIERWETPKGKVELSSERPLLGRASAKVIPGTYIVFWDWGKTGIVGNWSGYDALAIDFDNTTGKSLSLRILVGDKDWKKADTYWNRYNGKHIIPPGKYTFNLPITGLYRGEAGSRYNHLKYPIRPAAIVRLDLAIGKKGDSDKPVYLDNFRLIKTQIPDFIKAFDFGIPEQNMEIGFTPVTYNTVYTKQRGYGLNRKMGDKNRARDDTFPTVLYKDWVNMSEGSRDYEFWVDLPNGKYHVFTIFSDCGYWGGEAIRHTKRHIKAEGEIVWKEDLGEHGDYWKPNYMFENVEPLIGQSFWELYMAKIFDPKQFSVKVNDGQLNLKWHADKPWSTKVNSVIIYPDLKKREGEEFCEKIIAKQKKEFTVAAAETVPPEGGMLRDIPVKERGKGYIFFVTDYEKDTFQTTIPRPKQITREKKIFASKGEYEPISFAVRPLRDMGKATVQVSDFKGKDGVISKRFFETKVVRHLSRRGFGAVGYKIIPQMLKLFTEVDLPKNITREFFVIVRVPENTVPGDYQGTIQLKSTNGINEILKVTLTVYPFKLDESEFVFGFFGNIPDLKVAKLLRDHGFNSFGGGGRIGLEGFAEDGMPKLDFNAADKYMKMLRKAGYTQEGWGYGFRINNIRGTKTRAEKFFNKWERHTGLSYDQLLKKVFDEMKIHAKKNNWLPITYSLVDETRNIEVAKKQVVQIKALTKAAPWLKMVGSYSVSYKESSRKKVNYHQWIFEALDASSLNRHDESVMKKAKELGKEVYIYNQGTSRYSFGAYQWSEYQKGVKGRQQWHLHVQHGFQFFDLDGREPDTGVLYYGENGPIPTLEFIRSAEGVDDFYYCQTLYNRIAKAKKQGGKAALEAEKASRILTEIEAKIKLNERKKPDWLDNDTLRQNCAKAIIKLGK